jgi:hypothetical protein
VRGGSGNNRGKAVKRPIAQSFGLQDGGAVHLGGFLPHGAGLLQTFNALEVVVERLNGLDARLGDVPAGDLLQGPARDPCSFFDRDQVRRAVELSQGVNDVFVERFSHVG